MTPPPVGFARSRSRRLLPPGTLVAIAVAVLAVVTTAVLSYATLKRRQASVDQTTHAQQVIRQLGALLASMTDAETGQRGYLLTGDETYVEPYATASENVPAELAALQQLVANLPDQAGRLDTVGRLATEKLAMVGETIDARRAGRNAEALAAVRSDRGKQLMDRIRATIADMEADEQQRLDLRRQAWQRAVSLSSTVTWGGLALLLGFIGIAATVMSRDYRRRQVENWIDAGQMGLTERIQGSLSVDDMAGRALSFLAEYLDAQTGAVFALDGDGVLRRAAGHATAADVPLVRPGDGLAGQAVSERRARHVTNVPAGYLPVASSLGRHDPIELLVVPAAADGVASGVVELGFFRRLDAPDIALASRVSEALGVALRAAMDRRRQDALLAETQRQAEELQVQQEELRASNEELEEQGEQLRESQARLETQQHELEEINAQLEEQAETLADQKAAMARQHAALLEQAAALARANQYKSEFLANVSHELRTPLNSLLILAKLLADNKDANLTEEQVRFAHTILGAGNDLLALINDILDLSKIEAGRLDARPASVPLADIVATIGESLRATAADRGLAFSYGVEPGAPAAVETDAQRLGQILRNLLSNAFKFTDEGGVTLRASAGPGDVVAFAVSDTGIGIPVEQQEVIFEAFRQADGSTHRKYGGTGLGLSISRDLARLLGGELTVDSEPGQGSTFTLTLPRVWTGARAAAAPRPAAAAQPSRPAAAAASPGARPAVVTPAVEDDRDRLAPDMRSILVIEDDVRFATILRDLVREKGFQCLVAHTAADGLAAAMAHRPSAILLDVYLPDHSGLSLLDELKRQAETRHIPVHVVSGADATQQAMERGAVGYAPKPVNREQVLEALQRIEARLDQRLRRVLVVEDDARQRASVEQLLASDGAEIVGVGTAAAARAALEAGPFDCVVMDLNLPDASGDALLEALASGDGKPFPPVIVYTGRSLTADEEQRLARYSRSIIIKGARSPERLLDEVTLFLHQVESTLPAERQRMLKAARDREALLDGRRVLIVEDDARNIFAVSSILEPRGCAIRVARNGREAIAALAASYSGLDGGPIDLVLMDIMMPEMDGLTAMREIRKRPEWAHLPIIALTAKAMTDDHARCLAAGANDYIAKPLDVDRLLSLVRVWMPR
jgi:signal transduction histidine kinase/CheY-like chemotaxis protein/CHASE3 domain sensor protein